MHASGLEYASIGVCWKGDMSMDNGCYYFEGSHLYCNYYPTITKGSTQLFNTPPKFKEGDVIGMVVDFNAKTLEYLVNDESIFTTELGNNNEPLFVIGGMFAGTLQIV